MGRTGVHLETCDNPDETVFLPLNKDNLPRGKLTQGASEIRQVFDIRIQRWVTEYQAEVLIDEHGNRHLAPFPETAPKSST